MISETTYDIVAYFSFFSQIPNDDTTNNTIKINKILNNHIIPFASDIFSIIISIPLLSSGTNSNKSDFSF